MAIDRKIVAAGHAKPAEIRMNARTDIEMDGGRYRKPSDDRLRSAEHGEKVGKKLPVVTFRSNAVICHNCRRGEHSRGLNPLKGREQIVKGRAQLRGQRSLPLGVRAGCIGTH